MWNRIVYLSVILLLFLTFVSLNQSLIQVRAKDNIDFVYDSVKTDVVTADFNTLVSSYDKFFSKEFKENNCPGAAVTIVKDSGIKWLKGFI